MLPTLSLALLATGLPAPGPALPPRPAQADHRMDLVTASSGFGLLLPHRIFELNPLGFPTQDLVRIRSLQDLIDNVSPVNGVLPVSPWPTMTVLPDGSPGNHFVYLHFSRASRSSRSRARARPGRPTRACSGRSRWWASSPPAR